MASPNDVKGGTPREFSQGNRVIFNIKGNDYRLCAVVGYQSQIVPSGTDRGARGIRPLEALEWEPSRMKVIKTQTEYEAALNEIDELPGLRIPKLEAMRPMLWRFSPYWSKSTR